jgi:hypothetical protein
MTGILIRGKLVRDSLQVQGYQTISAETGEEGVRLA